MRSVKKSEGCNLHATTFHHGCMTQGPLPFLPTHSLQSWEVFGRSLRKTAKLLFGTKDKSKVQLFTVSTSEEEVTAGIFNCGAPGSEEQGNKCCWFKRVFSDMHSQKASDPAMMSYCDVMCDRCDVDQEAQKTLAHLKEARMTAKHIGWVARTG